MRTAVSGTRELMRIAYRDPEHVSERLTLYASQRLAPQSRDWAQRVRRERSDTPPFVAYADHVRQSTGMTGSARWALSPPSRWCLRPWSSPAGTQAGTECRLSQPQADKFDTRPRGSAPDG
jgi:hypothetical protein